MKVARVDDNQKQIVRYLRDKGVTVAITSAMGRGFPDLVCGYKNRNVLLELKDGSKPQSAQILTPEQKLFHFSWHGQIAIVNSAEAAWEEIQRHTTEKPFISI